MLRLTIEKEVIQIRFQPVTLQDKALFDSYLKNRKYESSFCTFTNFYMWRKSYHIEWTVEEELLCVKASYDNQTYFLPPFPLKKDTSDETFVTVIHRIEQYLAEQGQSFLIKGSWPEMNEKLERLFPGRFTMTGDRDNYDYVYLTKDLIGLKGRKYSQKKNHLNYFKRTFSQYEYVPLSTGNLEQCRETALAWYEEKDLEQDESLLDEREAVLDVLDNFSKLGLFGGAILIDGRMEAFSIGELLNHEMFVVHFEKGNPNIRGIYQVINQEFCKHAFPDITYVNREEDMGIEGLRQAKEGYHPVKFAEKYDITLK